MMCSRGFAGLGLLIGGLIVGISCTGPSPDATESDAEDERSRVYHVQLDMTEEKAEANQTLGQALEWWDEQSPSEVPRPLATSGESVVNIAWQAPLYRVRLGPFASRVQADSVLQAAQSAFPDAFVRPERVSSQH